MKQRVTTGIVLRRTNYGEADRILTVLTTDQGKIRLLAKGVRKIKSKLAGGIELLSVNDLTYLPGRAELGTLISSRLVRNFGTIITDVDRTMYAYEVLKLIDKNTEDVFDEDYFTVLLRVLEGVNDDRVALDWVRVWLYMHLLDLSGHAPNLKTDPAGVPLGVQAHFIFSFDDMAFVAHTAGEFDARSVKVLRLVQHAKTPSVLANIKNGQDVLPPLVQLTRTMYSSFSRP